MAARAATLGHDGRLFFLVDATGLAHNLGPARHILGQNFQSSMEIVATGPTPGSTPINVPTGAKVPKRRHRDQKQSRGHITRQHARAGYPTNRRTRGVISAANRAISASNG